MAGGKPKLPLNNLSPAKRNELVENNINLVWKYVHKIVKQNEYKEDAFQEGCLGLIRASRLYREDRDSKFITFAAFEIQCSIRDYLYNNRIIRIPDSQRGFINQYQTKLNEMEMKQCGLSGAEIDKIQKDCEVSYETAAAFQNTVSLDTPLNGNEMGETFDSLLDTIKDSANDYNNIELEELVQFCKDYIETAKNLDEEMQSLVELELENCFETALRGLKPIKCNPNDKPATKVETFIAKLIRVHPEWDYTKYEEDTPEYKAVHKLADNKRCNANSHWKEMQRGLAQALIRYGFVEPGQFARAK